MPARNGEMSGNEIEAYFKGKRHWGGVYFKDQLASLDKPANPVFYVVNMQSSTDGGEGTHWVLVFCVPIVIRGRECVVYFDPIGVVAPDIITRFMLKFKLPIFASLREVQNLTSSYCGEYCCIMGDLLLYMSHNLHLSPDELRQYSKIVPTNPGSPHFNALTKFNDKRVWNLYLERCHANQNKPHRNLTLSTTSMKNSPRV